MLEEYLRHIEGKGNRGGLRKSSVKNYQFFLRKFDEWMRNEKGTDITDFTITDVEKFAASHDNWGPKTKNQFYVIIKGFAKFLKSRLPRSMTMDEYIRRRDELDAIDNLMRYRVVEDIKKRAATREELYKILTACKDNFRDFSFIYLSAYFGTRKGELLSLRFSDVDFDKNLIILKGEKTKTGVGRPLFFNDFTAEVLEKCKRYYSSERILPIGLCSCNTICTKYQNLVQGGIFTPHSLRRTFITEMMKELNDEILVKLLAGHTTKTDMTALYSQRIDDMRVAMTEKHYMRDWGWE